MQRQTVFLISLVVVVAVLFTVTGVLARGYHGERQHLAQEWYQRGERELAAGRPQPAVSAFRNAIFFGRDEPRFQLRLAQALAAAGNENEARAYLRNLRESQPGSGTINLELARLAARRGDVERAVSYYHTAIYGQWEESPEANRRRTRLELARLLLDHNMRSQATAELVALAEDLPNDPALHNQVGRLLLRAGDYEHALALFRRAMNELGAAARESKPSAEAVVAYAGAGEASFLMGRYAQARQFLSRAAAGQGAEAATASRLLQTTSLVLSSDPFLYRLSGRERARRARSALEATRNRITVCAERRGEPLVPAAPGPGEPPAQLSNLQQLHARMEELHGAATAARLAQDAELLESTMEFVFQAQEQMVGLCGPAGGIHEALLIIARRREQPEA